MTAQYGMLTNIFINGGFFFCFLIGLLLPTDPEEFAEDEMWKLVSAMPAFFGLVTIMLWSLIFTEEPIAYCISVDRNEEAKRHLQRVYAFKDSIDDMASMNTSAKTSSSMLR